jgi:enoyl-CoA hydratase
MAASSVRVQRDGRIAIVRIDAGDARNLMSRQVIADLIAVARDFEDDATTSAIVLTGTSRVFTLGFDLSGAVAELPLSERRMLQALGPRMCRAWAELEPFTLCAVEGWCVGGGVALSAALDLRIAAHDARFYVPEIERGMNMSWQSVPRLVALIGPARTKRLIILAQRLDAPTAHDWGLVDVLAGPGGAFDAAMQIAQTVAAMPPVQVRMAKEGINAASAALHHAVSALDRDQFLLAAQSLDFREGVASFLERRPPHYTGG